MADKSYSSKKSYSSHMTEINNPLPKNKSAGQQTPILEAPPLIPLKPSKMFFIASFILALLISGGAVFGYLYYVEVHKGEVPINFLPSPVITVPQKYYSNDYWGFKFVYPGDWVSVIGSFDEGDYFFSSQNINFISELDPNEALLEVQTYNNLKGLSFGDWLTDREQNYFPPGKILQSKMTTVNGYETKEYIFQAQKPPAPNAPYWDMYIISKDSLKKYIFILETADAKSHDNFEKNYQDILNSLQFYNGFGS